MLRWPIEKLRPETAKINQINRSVRGSPSISGGVQVISQDAGTWGFELNNIIVHGSNDIILWRALDGLLEGQLNPIDVPFYNYEKTFQPIYSGELSVAPHSDGTYFEDGTGYVSAASSVTVKNDAALRAVEMDLSIELAETIQPGQHFSIKHPTKGNRLYRIVSAEYSNPINATIKFWPVLREAVTADTQVEFDRPVCQCKLASDDQMALTIQLGLYAKPSISFLEDL